MLQGSNLGPLLFLICIDELSRTLTCNHRHFADDVKMYDEINYISNYRIVQDSLNVVDT